MISTIVDWSSLGEAVYVSVGVGLGVLLVAAFAVVTSLRAQDARAAGESAVSNAFFGATAVCILALVGAVVAGIYLLTQ